MENEYCEDLSRLYQLLKQLFDAKIRNVFIDKNNKFLVSTFEDKKTNADDLINTLRTILSKKANSMVFSVVEGDFEIVLVTSQFYVQGKLHIGHTAAQA